MIVAPNTTDLHWFHEHRDPTAIFADFHEALRRNRVCHIVSTEVTLIDRHIELDLVRAIYDVHTVLDRLTRADTWESFIAARNKGISLHQDDMLAPAACAFMWGELMVPNGTNILDWSWKENIIALDPVLFNGENAWLCHMFEHDTNLHTRRPTLYGPAGREWTSRRIILRKAEWAIEVAPDLYAGDEETIPSADWLIFRLDLDMNAGRGRGRRKPVPPIRRLLDINRTIYPPGPSSVPTGREMPLHFRRGGFRTYRAARYINMQGKQGTFKPTIVRRDKAGEVKPPPVYNVVDRLRDE
jgi:hypothetical protein